MTGVSRSRDKNWRGVSREVKGVQRSEERKKSKTREKSSSKGKKTGKKGVQKVGNFSKKEYRTAEGKIHENRLKTKKS